MSELIQTLRRAAIINAIASSALSNLAPSEYGMFVYEEWIAGLDGAVAIALLKDHHKGLETALGVVTDGKAKSNLLGITDSARMRFAEADITTLRMAELLTK